MTLLRGGGPRALEGQRRDGAAPSGRGLNSYTFQLNLSRSCHSLTDWRHTAYPTKSYHVELKRCTSERPCRLPYSSVNFYVYEQLMDLMEGEVGGLSGLATSIFGVLESVRIRPNSTLY